MTIKEAINIIEIDAKIGLLKELIRAKEFNEKQLKIIYDKIEELKKRKSKIK